jgi:type II secretory pathway pseudopilin PulG
MGKVFQSTLESHKVHENFQVTCMTQTAKRISLLFLIGTLVSMILLTASLSNLDLHSGTPFPGAGNTDDVVQSIPPLSQVRAYSFPLLQGVLALVFIIVVFYTPIRLIARANLKIILQFATVMAVLIILVYLLPEVTPVQSAYILDESAGIATAPSFEYPVAPLGQPPQILIQIVIISIVFGVGLLIFIITKRRAGSNKIEAELLQQAEDAVDALQAGMNLRNVIIRCYLQMTHAIQEEQGIERNDTMTAREFEGWLEQKGFPSVPVRQLTSLFEKVRYSKQQTSNDDERLAIDSLNEIIRFCLDGRV